MQNHIKFLCRGRMMRTFPATIIFCQQKEYSPQQAVCHVFVHCCHFIFLCALRLTLQKSWNLTPPTKKWYGILSWLKFRVNWDALKVVCKNVINTFFSIYLFMCYKRPFLFRDCLDTWGEWGHFFFSALKINQLKSTLGHNLAGTDDDSGVISAALGPREADAAAPCRRGSMDAFVCAGSPPLHKLRCT